MGHHKSQIERSVWILPQSGDIAHLQSEAFLPVCILYLLLAPYSPVLIDDLEGLIPPVMRFFTSPSCQLLETGGIPADQKNVWWFRGHRHRGRLRQRSPRKQPPQYVLYRSHSAAPLSFFRNKPESNRRFPLATRWMGVHTPLFRISAGHGSNRRAVFPCCQL